MATYTLTEIQKESFTQRFDIYAPTIDREAGEVNMVGHQLVAENIPGRVTSRSEVSDLLPFGRGNIDQMDTTDSLRLPEIKDDAGNYINIGDGFIVQLLSGGGSEDGAWLQIAGEGTNRSTFAATRIYMITRTTQPQVIP